MDEPAFTMKRSVSIWMVFVSFCGKSNAEIAAGGQFEVRGLSWQNEGSDMKTSLEINQEIFRSYQNENKTDVCLDALTNYTTDLTRGEPYALKAMDSNGKLKSGMMLGAIMWNGQYSECIEIQREEFQGKWCVLKIGDQFKITSSFTIGRSVGLCFPAACNEDSLSEMVSEVSNATGIKLTIKCPVQPTKWTVVDILSLFFIIAIAFACILGTSVDMMFTGKANKNKDDALRERSESGQSISIGYTNTESKRLQVATAFSAIKNTRILFESYRKDNPLNCLHGIRFISMTWVILGHVHTFPWFAPVNILSNFGTFTTTALSATSLVIVNARLSVSTFFLIGGILVAYHGLKRLDFNHPGKKIIATYIKRYVRLTPSYALMILILAGVYSKTGSSPLWPEAIAYQKQACAKYWWTHLLYINDIYPVNNSKCFPVGWYLATDFQLFLISPIFILLLLKNKRIGLSALLISILSSTIVVMLLAITYDSKPIAIQIGLESYEITEVLSDGNMTGADLGRVFPRETVGSDLFRKPWTQFPVYGIGLIVGHFLHESGGKPKISKVTCALGWIIAIPSASALVYGLHPYMAIGSEPPQACSVMYETLIKPVWAMAVSWVILACVSGNTGPINWFLGSRYFTPLSKLTFGMYLVHNVIIQWFFSSLEAPIHFSTASFSLIYLAVVILSISGGYLLWIGIEAPVLNMLNLWNARKYESKLQNYDKIEEVKA